MRYLVFLLYLVVVPVAFAKDVFECRANSTSTSEPMVVLETGDDDFLSSGTITASGARQNAVYLVTGIDRKWVLTDPEDNVQYTFVMRPSGETFYYDFTGSDGEKVSPSQTFFCKSA